jgi:predicted GH43/DUF377 family glycosyl hydrolase
VLLSLAIHSRVAAESRRLLRQLAVASLQAAPETIIVAMNDEDHEYIYPASVGCQIREQKLEDYRLASRFLNAGLNENLYLIYSDDLYCWNGGTVILKPQFPWEFVRIGNCGSPIELDEGWLLLTHGVGPVRRYAIGAVLLDKADPSRVLARSAEPLVRPESPDREGYVPNVVYTCGAMRFKDRVILPYTVSDTFSTVATMKISALLASMQSR